MQRHGTRSRSRPPFSHRRSGWPGVRAPASRSSGPSKGTPLEQRSHRAERDSARSAETHTKPTNQSVDLTPDYFSIITLQYFQWCLEPGMRLALAVIVVKHKHPVVITSKHLSWDEEQHYVKCLIYINISGISNNTMGIAEMSPCYTPLKTLLPVKVVQGLEHRWNNVTFTWKLVRISSQRVNSNCGIVRQKQIWRKLFTKSDEASRKIQNKHIKKSSKLEHWPMKWTWNIVWTKTPWYEDERRLFVVLPVVLARVSSGFFLLLCLDLRREITAASLIWHWETNHGRGPPFYCLTLQSQPIW